MGQHAFFGLGAYTTGIIWLHNLTHTGYYFDPVTMILSGLVPVVLAIIIGIPLLSRLRGDYFALGTLGMGQIIQVIFVKGGKFTGASDGLHLPSTIYTSMKPYYWTGLILAIVSTVVVYFMTRSRIGLALRAIREDETSAASHGVHVLDIRFALVRVRFSLRPLRKPLRHLSLSHQPRFGASSSIGPCTPSSCASSGDRVYAWSRDRRLFMTAVFNLADIYLVGISPILAGILIVIVMKFMPGGLAGLTEKMAFARRKKTV